ncbi:MAG: hypothetical protein IJM36_04395 [Acholeplasmatales bacterium]|nr:hypothetical protein [Acholeplasmatales bacterium]
MEEICKVCKTNFKTKEGIIHFCPNCGYKTISAKERNDYLKDINKKLDKDLKIELSSENKEANATSISKAFNYLYSDSLNLSLEDIYNLTSICFKEVDDKNEYIYHVLADIYLLCSTYMPADRYYLYWLNKSAEAGNSSDKLTLKYLTEGLSNIDE